MAGRRKSSPPRWLVAAAGEPTIRFSSQEASSSRQASELFMKQYGKALAINGGFVRVTDCETGREERFRVIPRGMRR